MAAATIETVREMLMDSLNLHEEYEPAEIDPDGALFGEEGLGLDSLDALQLAVAIEEKFGVAVGEEEGQKVFLSIRAITNFVNQRSS
jgi:acyl carrier protein